MPGARRTSLPCLQTATAPCSFVKGETEKIDMLHGVEIACEQDKTSEGQGAVLSTATEEQRRGVGSERFQSEETEYYDV